MSTKNKFKKKLNGSKVVFSSSIVRVNSFLNSPLGRKLSVKVLNMVEGKFYLMARRAGDPMVGTFTGRVYSTDRYVPKDKKDVVADKLPALAYSSAYVSIRKIKNNILEKDKF